MSNGVASIALEVKFAADKPMGSFSGYGAVYGNIDEGGDMITPGAMARSLASWGAKGMLPAMYYNHDRSKGAVGVWEKMAEDQSGLHVEGRIIGLDTDEGKMTYARLREGAIKGMSIGYRVPAGGSKMGTGRTGEPRRWLKAIDLREVSVVDDPMNPLAKLAYLKSAPALILDARGLEAALRDEHKMSIAEAKSLVAVVRRHLRDAGDEHADASRDDEVEALVASLKRAASILSTKG